jgi:hypothetical protein
MFGLDNPFESNSKKPFGYLDTIMDPGKDQKKATSKKPVTKKKPEAGKKYKHEDKALPECDITCPYCKERNRFPKGITARFCGKCGKAYFR